MPPEHAGAAGGFIAKSAAQLQEPQRLVVTGDGARRRQAGRAVAGVASIKSAGMWALGIGDPTVLRQADRVIPSLAHFELQDY